MTMSHPHEEWEIRDDHAAEWAVDMIRQAEADTRKWETHFAAQLEKIRQKNQDTVQLMTRKLEQYFVTLPRKRTKTQESYQLPTAKLVRKAQQPTYTRNNAELLPYLKANAPELVEVTESPMWGELKKRIVTLGGQAILAETGEVIPGVTVEERAPAFGVSMKEDTDNE